MSRAHRRNPNKELRLRAGTLSDVRTEMALGLSRLHDAEFVTLRVLENDPVAGELLVEDAD